MQKAITIYTPEDVEPHIFAEDDAQIYRSIFGRSGITEADNKLACSIIDDNTVRISSGVFCNQGYMVVVPGGNTIDLNVQSGTQGAFRHDLIVADFTRGGGSTADTHVIKVLTGTAAQTEESAQDPTLTQQDLTASGTRRQEPLYRIVMQGTTLHAVERIAPYVGSVYQ